MKINKKELLIVTMAISFMMFANVALASTGGLNVEYETGLKSLAESITGPVSFYLSIIGMAASGFMVLWGGEISQFVKIACGIVLIVGFIVFSSNVFTSIYGISGALIYA